MAAKFIIGPAGSGKTRYCCERLADSIRREPLGPAIYWILPRQATFVAERQLAASSGLNGYFRARILDFEDLCAEILAECGGTALPEITERGRRMILGHILRKFGDELQFFRSVAHQPGVAIELDGTFAELERSGHGAGELTEKLQSVSATPALRAKVHDLGIIYSHYMRFLGQDRIDPARRLAESLGSIERCRSLREAEIYVDSFYDFTGLERQLIVSLGKVCKSVSITMLLDPRSECVANPHHVPDEMSLLHRSEEAYRRLWFALEEEGVEVESPVILKEPRRFRGPGLREVHDLFWDSSGKPVTGKAAGQSIHLINAPDFRTEVDSAARWIRRLVDEGMRYRDICVLMRSQDDYLHDIEASFREHEIPFFVDRRRSASHHPLLRFIRGVLAVAITNWSHDAMMAVIKTGLTDLSREEADELENYVLLHGIDHSIWISARPWTGRRARDEEFADAPAPLPDAVRMDGLRRPLVDRLGQFVKSATEDRATVKSLAGALFRVLADFGCGGKIVKWMDEAAASGRLEEQGEHDRVWKEMVQLLDEIVELFGDEAISLADFSGILETALEAFDLALTPPTLDQVLVGTVDRTRTAEVRACAVLGLAEGQFPRASGEDSIFTDADRRHLAAQEIELNPESGRRLLDENFLGYIAMTRASERLLLTRRVCDEDGRTIGPSPLWERVAEIVPTDFIVNMPVEAKLKPRFISTPRQMVDSLMRWVREGASDPVWEPVYRWLAARPACDDAVDRARYRAWKALIYGNEAKLEAGRAAELFPSPLRVTARQLESFRMCPYQHFARYGLGLKEREKRQVGAGDLSRIFHEVLGRLVKEMIESSESWRDRDDAEERLARLTEEIGQGLRDELMLSTARNRYLLGHVEKTLLLVASAQRAAAERGGFRPGMVNVGFGSKPGDAMPPLSIRTPAGKEALVSGKIDRIDLLPDGSACATDYRLTAEGLDACEVFHGLSLQLLSYLLVLEKNGKHLTADGKLSPAAAFCVQLLRSVKKGDPQDAPGPEEARFHLMVKPRGIFDLRVVRQLDNLLGEGHSQVVQLFLKKDGTVGHAEKSDAAASGDFSALLRHIEMRIGQIADEIMSGRIEIRPYRLGIATPCPRCEFRALCRLEPSPGCYDDLEAMKRPEMLARVTEEGRR